MKSENFKKAPFIIYGDMDALLKKTDICINNPKNSSTNKMKLHIACGYSLLTKWYHWNMKKINHVIKKIYYVSN